MLQPDTLHVAQTEVLAAREQLDAVELAIVAEMSARRAPSRLPAMRARLNVAIAGLSRSIAHLQAYEIWLARAADNAALDK